MTTSLTKNNAFFLNRLNANHTSDINIRYQILECWWFHTDDTNIEEFSDFIRQFSQYINQKLTMEQLNYYIDTYYDCCQSIL